MLADAAMPGKNGYDLCLALKSDGKLADVPVVILSATAAPYDAAQGAQVGADAQPAQAVGHADDAREGRPRRREGRERRRQAGQAAAAAAATPARASTPRGRRDDDARRRRGRGRRRAANQPPRSATIMGMPTIKMPAGTATP